MRIYNDFEIEVTDINNLKKGRVTVGSTMYLTTHILPLILPEFKEKCPNIELNILEENSTELEHSLSAGMIDFAIMHTAPFHEISKGNNTIYHLLFRDPFLLVTKKEHPLGKYAVKNPGAPFPKIDPLSLRQGPFIMIWKGQRIRQVAEIILQRADINPLIALTTKSYETARRLACVGIGVTFVPYQYSRIFTGDYQPDYYSLDDAYSPYWNMCVAVQKNSYISKAAKLLIDMICEKVGAESPGI
jgi:DNA-binding transcriptional LysR family regulator